MNLLVIVAALPLALGQSGIIELRGHDAGNNTLMYRQVLAIVTDWREDGFYHRSDFEWPAISLQIFSTPDNVLGENALAMGAGVGINNIGGARDLHLHLLPGIQTNGSQDVRWYGEGGLRYYPAQGSQFKGIARVGEIMEVVLGAETPSIFWTIGFGAYGEWRSNADVPGSSLVSADVIWRFAPRFAEIHFGFVGARVSSNDDPPTSFALRVGVEILN